MYNQDYVLCECDLEALEAFVSSQEKAFEVHVLKKPSICMTMIQAEDSVELQPFYLGEALTTECEISVEGKKGIGICLGDEPVRCYCIAFVDAVIQLEDRDLSAVYQFLEDQNALIAEARKIEYNHILRTKVDFKLMEED